MLLIGHRGCAYPGYNQNTIRAFEKVTSEGVLSIEFDVQLCADGQLVVVHNLDLEEVSSGTGKVITTDSKTLKKLYAGDPVRGKDRIPFLAEVFDFFASVDPDSRPTIQLELKGDGIGKQTGELLASYVTRGSLQYEDFLVSSFNWQELVNVREVCPTLDIALLDGSIRRNMMIEKIGIENEHYFEDVFYYGGEQYMLPRFPSLSDNIALLENKCLDTKIRNIFIAEIKSCLRGDYYTDKLLDTACEMNAVSVNLWFRTVSGEFVDKAHRRGLAVYVYTVNAPDDLLAMVEIGVDGVFTDYYKEATEILQKHSG